MTTTPERTRRRRTRTPRPRPSRPDVVVVGKTPLAEIHIYDDMVLLTRRDGAKRWRSYPVSVDALTQVLARVPISTGLLPPNTIGAGRVSGEAFYVVYVPPRTARLQTPNRFYTIPLPPLVWAGCGREYRIFAIAPALGRISMDTPLFVAPFPNCYTDGRICWGDIAAVPNATPTALLRVLTLFLEESQFNTHLAGDKSNAYPVSVLKRWEVLEAASSEAYPTGDLVGAQRSLDYLISGQAWGGGR